MNAAIAPARDSSRASVDRTAQSVARFAKPHRSAIARHPRPLVQALYARIAPFEPNCIRIVEAALDRLSGRSEFDLMHELAEPVPVACIGHNLGVPPETLATFRQWLDGIVQTISPNRTPGNVAALVADPNGHARYIRGRFADAKLSPPDDLFGDMARAQMAGAPITDTRSPTISVAC